MKRLIVQDNLPLVEIIAELLLQHDKDLQAFGTTIMVSDWRRAMSHLPNQHAVLYEGLIPLRSGSRFLMQEWDVVRHEARRRSIRCVLYIGFVPALDRARECPPLALAKPATVEEICAALAGFPLPVINRAYGTPVSLSENRTLSGEDDAPDF